MTTGETIALTRWTFVSKVMSLLLNMLSRLVITFLPRSKLLLISWLQSPSAVILEPRKIKSVIVSTVSPSICHEVMKKAERRRIDAFELWCWRRLLRVPWTARRSNQSILKEISPGMSLEGMMLKLKPVLWPPHARSWFIGKDSDAGRDWGQEEKGTSEDEMAGWHHRLNGHEFGWTPGVGDGQGGLACCNSWGHKELDTTERLNWTELTQYPFCVGACI